MVCKILALALFVACTQAIRYDHEATSSINFNNNHNSVHHTQSAYAAPSHGYPAPSHYSNAAPQYSHQAPQYSHQAPQYSHQAIQYSHSSPQYSQSAPDAQYAAPVIKVAAPVVFKSSAPSHEQASSFSSLSFGNDAKYAAPKHYAVPAVAKFIAPVAKIVAAPVYHAAPAVAKFVAPVAAPAYQHAPSYHHEEEYAPAKYDFAYGVEDHKSGDFHSHKESRDGDVTHGEYSLQEADGTIRTVKYSVDKHSGFNAVVEKSGNPQPTKVVLAAPVYKAVPAPAPYYHH